MNQNTTGKKTASRPIRQHLLLILAGALILLPATGCDQNSSQNSDPAIAASAKLKLNRARFAEAALTAEALKRDIALCMEEEGMDPDSGKCSSGASSLTYRIPEKFATRYFASVEVKSGSIIMTAVRQDTLDGETYILDPVIRNGRPEWELAPDSTCIKAGYC
jgi:hypothetical protein